MRGSDAQRHWDMFKRIPYEAQGATGVNPTNWVNSFGIDDVPGKELLPNLPIDRARVRAICIDPAMPALLGYVCAMAWGGQGAFKRDHVRYPWTARDRLEISLDCLRNGGLSRSEAYKLFCGDGRISGLGPAFFTKLLYFFGPEPNCYIMDQWTAKSMMLLTGLPVVKMSGDSVSADNTGDDYETFCHQIDLLAKELGCDGHVAEERIFSAGGAGRRAAREWRTYVKVNWKPEQRQKLKQ